ncbi:hypothetical protein EV652_12415 [Kribbella steppae]|uniref:Uncharacterized protein n=1 Tax=Kribbella steppae TaxID=2512223 RepID=A0A4R2GXK8_9ACTN|nr:hypothetical protein [Kribbella steppae]TCO14323.1 hypothetical protein EV652_12415 [Kribbella steppae]
MTLPDHEWAGERPALPDGSMPAYGSYPLPGMPGGDPPPAAFGWGPELGGDEQYPLGHRKPAPRGLVVALIVICGLVLAGLITVVAIRASDSSSSAPGPTRSHAARR